MAPLARLAVVALLAALPPAVAFAQADGPSEEEMIRALAPRPAATATRDPPPAAAPSTDPDDDATPSGESAPGLRLRGRKAVTAKAARDAAEGAREGRLQLSVQFELGSAAILEESRALLARLARAMASPALAGLAYRIEGHTDATGGVALNQRLSERRAESVTAFLIAAAGLPEDRFVPVGFGSSQPLDPANPEAAVNRRVVVVSLERPAGSPRPGATAAAAPAPTAASNAPNAKPAAPVSAASTSPAPKPAAPESPAAAAPPAPAQPAAQAITMGDGGRLQHAKGAIELQKAQSAAPVRVEAGARVEEGDVITAGPGATALVQFDDGANVIIRPDSSVKLAKLKHSGDGLGQLVQVITGACRYVTGSIGRVRPQAVALATPTATVGIRGTDLEVAYREGGTGGAAPGTYVRVNEGGVRVGGLDGTRVDLSKGEQAFAGRPVKGLRGEPVGPAVKRVTEVAGVFATGELDALIGGK